ncbi:MAG: sugar phosphate isomerase/epimerase family protein [Ruthenibacterium lactatiformans]
MDYLTTCLETAGQLGAGILAGPLYTGGGKRHWLSPDEKKREWMLAVDGLRELARRAEHYGVVLSVEPLNRYRTSVANTAGQVLRMVEEVTRPMWASLRHISRLPEERDLCAALEQVLQAGKVNHFHACANNRGAPDGE